MCKSIELRPPEDSQIYIELENGMRFNLFFKADKMGIYPGDARDRVITVDNWAKPWDGKHAGKVIECTVESPGLTS